MQSSPEITFRNMPPSPVIMALIEKRTAVLERACDRITGCEITLDAQPKRKRHGREFRVRINLRIPGPDLRVVRDICRGSAQDDLKLAVNRAFSAAEARLHRQKRLMGGVEVKWHPPLLHGEVTRLEPELGYGYARADDGREVYFQRDSLTRGNWTHIAPGQQLRFRVFEGEKGPFAVAVTPINDNRGCAEVRGE